MMNHPASDLLSASSRQAGKPGDLLLIALITLLLYLTGNSQVSLWDRDEPRYAQATREMLARGDWVVPTFNGEPRYHKPVLIYWLMALSYSVFGDTEFGARFFSAVAGMLTCLLTYRLGTRMGGRRVGLAAGWMLAVSPLMLVESKLATTDAVLMVTVLGAMSCAWDLQVLGFSWSRALIFWALIGISILTKGPIGPGIVAAALLVWMWLSRQWVLLERLRWAAGAIVVSAIVLPWGILVYHATQGEFYREALGRHVIGRALAPMENHRGFPGYYFATTLAGLFPWTLGLSIALRGVRRWLRSIGPASFLLGWMIGPMLILELVQTKLIHYYLPAYPAWTLLMARGFVELHDSGQWLASSLCGYVRCAALLVTGFVLASLVTGLAVSFGPQALYAPCLAASIALSAGTGCATYLFCRRRDRAAWGTLVATWGVLGLVTAGWLLPVAEVCRIERAAAFALQAQSNGRIPIVLHAFREPSLIFYLGRPVRALPTSSELCAFVEQHGAVVTLLRERELARVAEEPRLRVEILETVHTRGTHPLGSRSAAVAKVSYVAPADQPTQSALRPPNAAR